MLLRRYVEQILNLYNYMDGILVTDAGGIVAYCATYRPDVSSLQDYEVLGKHVLDIYPELSEDTSSILRVLRTGEPVFNEYQRMKNYKGNDVYAVNTTVPIRDSLDNIIGAVDISRYIGSRYERKSISLPVDYDERQHVPYYDLDDIVSKHPSMLEIKRRIEKIARTDSSVLICGETGTGKELIAQSIHVNSRRRASPFVAQNCAAIPANLLEGILFGTEKGSYTGAETKKGLFELAQGGTLFLDEINSMDYSIQAKVLRAIEEKKIRRLGGGAEIDLDVRFLSSVNEEPEVFLKENRVRRDLFFRLAAVQLFVPPLRERRSDIPALAGHFIKQFNAAMHRNVTGITEEVESIFMSYDWPGNVREMKNVVEGAFNIINGTVITRLDLPEYLCRKSRAEAHRETGMQISLPEKVDAYEKKLIIEALRNAASVTEAAGMLKISKQSLNYKIEKYGLKKQMRVEFEG